jgi:hypothetical protein
MNNVITAKEASEIYKEKVKLKKEIDQKYVKDALSLIFDKIEASANNGVNYCIYDFNTNFFISYDMLDQIINELKKFGYTAQMITKNWAVGLYYLYISW